MSAHIATVQRIYEAFSRGDIPAILAHVADDVEWEYDGHPEIPWLVPRHGKTGVTEFFHALGAIDIRSFVPKTIVGSERVVVALIDVEFVVRSTARRVKEPEEVHIWHFDTAGRVSRA